MIFSWCSLPSHSLSRSHNNLSSLRWVSISPARLSLSLSFSLHFFLFHFPLLISSLRVFLFLPLFLLSVVDQPKPLSFSRTNTFFSAMLRRSPFLELSLLLLCFALVLPSLSLAESDRLETANSTESNVSLSKPKEGSFAHMIDQALANEFPENDQPEGS